MPAVQMLQFRQLYALRSMPYLVFQLGVLANQIFPIQKTFLSAIFPWADLVQGEWLEIFCDLPNIP